MIKTTQKTKPGKHDMMTANYEMFINRYNRMQLQQQLVIITTTESKADDKCYILSSVMEEQSTIGRADLKCADECTQTRNDCTTTSRRPSLGQLHGGIQRIESSVPKATERLYTITV